MTLLAGTRVIEFCQVAAGPFCGMLLADLGCDVIKVESPAGDSMRQWPPFTDGYSDNFASLNRNKRSVVLDLKSSDDNAAAKRLSLSANVVIENNRPGVMERLGLGYESLKAANPKLVYCSISAFGQTGPRRAEGGFDLTIQAMGGVMSVTGEPGRPPVKCGVPISDFSAGLYAAYAIAAALARVRSGGKGCHIDIPMLGATLGVAALQTSEYFGTGIDPTPRGSAHPRNAPYQAFQAQNGYFVMAAGNNKLWEAVCETISRPDLISDPRFASTSTRAKHQEELRVILEGIFANHAVSDLLERFTKAGVPCSPINSYGAALQDPQVAALGWVKDMELPGGGRIKTFSSPIRIEGVSDDIYREPPALGAHTKEVLAERGIPVEASHFETHT